MELNSEGWIESAQKVPSPNFHRLPDRDVYLIVIHNISLPPGEFGGPYIDRLFTNSLQSSKHPYLQSIAHLRVSAHLLIRRNGSITQYVSFDDCAHHAGESSFAGRSRCNDFSIGIELEGTDDMPYSDEQYEQLARVTDLLMVHYPKIRLEGIVGHCDVAPERKTDPGRSFDWIRYKRSLSNST